MRNSRGPRLILAFDPGSQSCGHAEILPLGPDRYKVLGLGALSMRGRVHWRLGWLLEDLEKLLAPYKGRPADVVVEKHFIGPGAYGTITLAESRGVILAAIAHAGFQRLYEYAPNTVKKGITGNGRAEKWQLANVVKRMLGIDEDPPLDATDAAGLALYHALHRPAGGAPGSSADDDTTEDTTPAPPARPGAILKAPREG